MPKNNKSHGVRPMQIFRGLLAIICTVIPSICFDVPIAVAQITFAPAVNYGGLLGPWSATTDDLDADGDTDLAVANFGNGNGTTVSVLLNNGTGTFSSPTGYPASSGPISVTAGDFDRDGDVDLAAVSRQSSVLSVLFNNGTGSFSAPVNYGGVASPWDVKAGDLDGDGDIDLAAANQYVKSVSIFLNNGDGSFAAAVMYSIDATEVIGLAVADLDNDGDLDVALTASSTNIAVLPNNGNGTFGAPAYYASGAAGRVIAEDIDADGDRDLIATNGGTNEIAVLLNNGNATFAAPTNYATGSSTHGVAAGDFDRDGDVDLVAVNMGSDNVSVFSNNGNGTFAAQLNFAVGGQPSYVTVDDVDKNGALDLIVTNSADGRGTPSVSILLNQTAPPPLIGIFVNDASIVGDVFTFAIGDDVTGDGSRGRPFRTMNKAVSVALAGDTIFVDAGTYTEGNVQLKAQMSLIGADSALTQIVQTHVTSGGGCRFENFGMAGPSPSGTSLRGIVDLTSRSENIVRGLDIRGVHVGIWADQPGHDNLIENNLIRSYQGFGVGFRHGSQRNIVRNNVVISGSTSAAAIYLERSDNNVILNNFCSDNEVGVALATSSNNLVAGNVTTRSRVAGIASNSPNDLFRNNLTYGNSGHGIQFQTNNGVPAPTGNILLQNESRGNGGAALNLEGGPAASNLFLKNNLIASTPAAGTVFNQTGLSVDVRRNYFGTTDRSQVSASFRGSAALVVADVYRFVFIDTAEGADTIAPATPQNITAADLGNGHVRLTWQGPAADEEDPTLDDIAGYRIYRSPAIDPPQRHPAIADLQFGATSFEDTSPPAGTVYYWLTSYDQNPSGFENESWFSDTISVQLIPAGTFVQVAPTVGMIDGSPGIGVAWGDYDGDGDLDAFVSNGSGQQDFLYRNNGNGTFTDVATGVGMTGASFGSGAAWGDYDNDGDLDLFVANAGNQQDFLYRNNGNGTFTNVAAGVGMADGAEGIGAAWQDYDLDGDLDLFVANTAGQQDFLYRNNGDGTFTDVAAGVGIIDGLDGQGAAWGDYDNDGHPDLFVANHNGHQDFLYNNNGDGTFTDVAAVVGMADGAEGIAADWADYDADGDLDLFVANHTGQQDFLYRNNSDGTFTEVAAAAGMMDAAFGAGAAWGDYDNDGDLDLYVPNHSGQQDFLYRNNGDGTFTSTATTVGMTDASHGISGAWSDYDNDGDVDLYVANDPQQDFLYKNSSSGKNHIKVFALTDRNGDAQELDAEADRLAIGAKVEIDLDGGGDFAPGAGRLVTTRVGIGDGLSQYAGPVHVGVGTRTAVDVRVTFPDGDVVVQSGVAVNQAITVKDPGAAPPADVIPPTITNATATPNSLWPPNHKMVNVTVTANVQDDQDPSPSLKIIGVTSSEPDDGMGDGNTTGDFVITGDLTVQLRAERSGKGIGRFYTITLEAEDASGNTSTATVTVRVPKSQGK